MVLSVVRDYSLPGGYRAIVVRPTDMEWKMFRYNDTTASLALSDIDYMNGVEEPQSIEGRAGLCSSSFFPLLSLSGSGAASCLPPCQGF